MAVARRRRVEGRYGSGARILWRPWRAGGGEQADGSGGGHGRDRGGEFSAAGNGPLVGGRANGDNAESNHFPFLFFLVFAVEV